MKASVYTLGCKINQYESMGIMGQLAAHGFDVSDKLEFADIFVLNTCAVTSEAERKSRQTVTKITKLNPDAKVLVLGCSAQNNKNNFEAHKNVVWLSGNADKTQAVEDFLKNIQHNDIEQKYSDSGFLLPKEYKDGFSPLRSKTRAYVKVQDGCNNFCSYCIVPYLRGRSRSRDTDSIVEEINATDAKEIVITGIDLSSYGLDIDSNLTGLLQSLPQGKHRYRLGSLEPNIITEDFLQAVKESGVCEHFHLSMQSGSKRILQAMNRKYTPEIYLSKVGLIRKFFNFANITTDVIAGFPGETEEEHEESKRTVIKAQFGDMHVFPYSIRAGTVAATYTQVEKSVKERRARELSDIAAISRNNFIKLNEGRTLHVLAEDIEEGFMTGYSDNYIKVKLPPNTQPDSIVSIVYKNI